MGSSARGVGVGDMTTGVEVAGMIEEVCKMAIFLGVTVEVGVDVSSVADSEKLQAERMKIERIIK